MAEIKVKRKHHHDGGDVVEGEKFALGQDCTVSRCSCGVFVRYVFRGDESVGGWCWVKLNPWYRWKWRRDLKVAG